MGHALQIDSQLSQFNFFCLSVYNQGKCMNYTIAALLYSYLYKKYWLLYSNI